jgi:hypothetical protein
MARDELRMSGHGQFLASDPGWLFLPNSLILVILIIFIFSSLVLISVHPIFWVPDVRGHLG